MGERYFIQSIRGYTKLLKWSDFKCEVCNEVLNSFICNIKPFANLVVLKLKKLEFQEVTFIEQLKNKETQEKAFRDLISLYKERLYWHVRKIVIIHDDADDVLQNTFVKVFKNIGNFKGNSKLFSWMYRIATNEAITHLNRKSNLNKIDNLELQNQLVENLYADEYFDGDEIQLKLQMALATLPQKQRIIFNMKYFDNMKYTEMSDILETSVGGLKASYHHARKKIEKFILNETK